MPRLFITICMALLLSALCISTSLAEEETVRIATGEWEPYLSQYMPHYGPLNRIVTEAFALEGVKVEYRFFPWKRALVITKNGVCDGTSLWGYHEKRFEDFYHSDAVAEQKYVFFHLKEFKFDWQTFTDLEGLRIGATLGYNYHKEFQNAEKEGKIIVERVPSDEQNIKKLLAGRIHLALLEMVVAKELMRSLLSPEERGRITYHPKLQSKDGLHLLLSKKVEKNKRLIEKFNEGLRQLKEDGKVDQYIQDAMEGQYRKQKKWFPKQ